MNEVIIADTAPKAVGLYSYGVRAAGREALIGDGVVVRHTINKTLIEKETSTI